MVRIIKLQWWKLQSLPVIIFGFLFPLFVLFYTHLLYPDRIKNSYLCVVLYLFFYLAMTAWLAALIWRCAKQHRLIKEGVQVNGVVEKVWYGRAAKPGVRGPLTIRVVFQAEGQTVSDEQGVIVDTSRLFKVGDTVRVFADKLNPRSYVVLEATPYVVAS